MSLLKAVNERNMLLPAILTFTYVLLPMVISVPDENQAQQVYHLSPAAEANVQSSPSLSVKDLGKGGPIDELFYGEQSILSSKEYSPPEPVEITKLNKLNYSNAIYPVFPSDVSSDFGWREPPCDICSSDHQGVDFVPGRGSEVRSILDGLVVQAGINGGYGHWVVIEHLVPSAEDEQHFERWQTLYAHLKEGSIPENVSIGSIVTRGQVIGLVGNTGVSTGDHLHFEIIIDDLPQDPVPLLAKYSRIEILKDGTERFIRYE